MDHREAGEQGGHAHPADDKPVRYRIGIFSICLLGIGRLVGSRCKYWNEGLQIGETYFLIFSVLTCMGTMLMASCLAEMAGALPFTGGSFGYARAIYGPFLGYIVGVLEILTNVFGLASLMLTFGQACASSLRLGEHAQPIFYLVLFGVTAAFQLLSMRRFTTAVNVLVLLSLLLTLLYVGGALLTVSTEGLSFTITTQHSPSATDILARASIPTYFFTGLELLPVTAHFSNNPRRAISYGLLSAVVFGCLAIVSTATLTVGQGPAREIIQSAALPLNFGYAQLFGVSDILAGAFNIPLTLTSFVVGEYFLCIIIRSLAESNLLPHVFARYYREDVQFPYVAVLASYLLCIVSAVVGFFCLYYSFSLLINLSYFIALCFYTLYICLFLTFISFRRRLTSIPKYFTSPFGVSGAYLGIIIYCFFGLSTCFFPRGVYFFVAFLVFLVVLTVVYLRFVRQHQRFSFDEERVFFVAYVVRANRKQRKRIAQRARAMQQRLVQSQSQSQLPWWQTLYHRFLFFVQIFSPTSEEESSSLGSSNHERELPSEEGSAAERANDAQEPRDAQSDGLLADFEPDEVLFERLDRGAEVTEMIQQMTFDDVLQSQQSMLQFLYIQRYVPAVLSRPFQGRLRRKVAPSDEQELRSWRSTYSESGAIVRTTSSTLRRASVVPDPVFPFSAVADVQSNHSSRRILPSSVVSSQLDTTTIERIRGSSYRQPPEGERDRPDLANPLPDETGNLQLFDLENPP